MKNIFGFLLLISLVFNACSDDDQGEMVNENFDKVLFGAFFGECSGEICVEVFKIEDLKLYEDTNDEYPVISGNSYEWSELANDKYELIENFADLIPDEIFNETDRTFGMPDAGDWGGLFLSVSKEGSNDIFIIDNINDNIPEYLHPLADGIRDHVELLK